MDELFIIGTNVHDLHAKLNESELNYFHAMN